MIDFIVLEDLGEKREGRRGGKEQMLASAEKYVLAVRLDRVLAAF